MEIKLPAPADNPDYDRITGAVGRCITCWARVEDELGNLFTHMTRTEEDFGTHAVSRRIFYSVRSFEARLSLVEAAMEGPPELNDDLRKEWASLYAKLQRKGKKRNEIAHCAVIAFQDATTQILFVRILAD